MKFSRGPILPAICALAILIAPFTGLLPDYWITLFNYIGISSLVAIGLVLLTGVGGMTSFGQAAFVGFGAYTSAVLTTRFGISPWLTLPASLIVTMAVAGLIGAVTVRLSGHYLPLGTIAWGIAFFYLFGNIDWLGAHDGLAGIPPLRLGTHPLINPRDYFVVVWIAVVLAVIATQNLLGGRIGRAIRALRRSTRAAEAFGVNTAAAKLMVFVYAAMLAGLAGWLYAHFQRSVSPGPFGITTGTEYLLMAVLGGAGRVYGAILGAAGITFLRDQLQNFLPWLIGNTGNYETIAFGAVLVLILQTASSGVWPILFGPPPPPTPPEPRDGTTTPERTLPAPGTALLQVQDARKVFGGLVAVNDVNFDVQSGRIIGLIGPNGAGKSTTFNLITGVLPLSSGKIQFEGHALRTQTPQRAAALGLGRTFQHVEIVADMSVIENVALGAHLLGRAGPLRAILRLDRAEEALLFANARRQLDRVGLADVAFRPAGTLALGQLRLVEVARALCLHPVLLLLDEPAAGLRVGEKKALARLLREVRSEGLSVLLVEHDMDFVMSLADRLVVLDFGTRIAEGVPAEIRQHPAVLEAYLGGVS
jgi:branched-chain amino acid transport system permease protein